MLYLWQLFYNNNLIKNPKIYLQKLPFPLSSIILIKEIRVTKSPIRKEMAKKFSLTISVACTLM